ncbi:hypothetical protein ACEWY4_013881 [Coilia grayii]|uniref:Gypsy retrotransposon integrase-like protein 1 n=1 Tax=Coilia grayii TaxID=363190 RepID=A0ABD1JXL8_9TELE
MSAVEDFFAVPSEVVLDSFTKDQLRRVAEHYEFETHLAKDLKKQQLKEQVKATFVELSVIPLKPVVPVVSSTPNPSQNVLSFEQQLDLLKVQTELKRIEREREYEWLLAQKRLEASEREKERALEYEKLKQHERQMEQENELQKERLKLFAAGKIPGDGGSSSGSLGSERSLSSMIKFLPRFNDRDPDIFFSLFESVADERGWSSSDRTLLLQTVFTGRAQDAFIALSVADRKDYVCVKEAVLRAYEQVPEFYRQRFRSWKKTERQTYSEVARDIVSFFDRWCSSVNVKSFQQLCDLIVLEQFINILPERLATFIHEHKIKTATEAAVLADEYVLTHRCKGREFPQYRSYTAEEHRPHLFNGNRNYWPDGRKEVSKFAKADMENRCNYCLESGHWKKDCPSLRNKNKKTAKFAGCAAPVHLSSGAEVSPSVSRSLVGGEGCAVPDSPLEEPSSVSSAEQVSESYGPFITEGIVSLVGTTHSKKVKILRDTGATETFVVESALPFSDVSSTGKFVLIQGIGMQTLSVPLHRIVLNSDLVQGDVTVAVRPSLPVPGVDVILGNVLAKDRVWPSVSVTPVVSAEPVEDAQDECVSEFPDVFTACAVTRAQSRSQTHAVNDSKHAVTLFPVLPPSFVRSDFIVAQKGDVSLSELWAGAMSADKWESAERGYFNLDGLLVRKFLFYDRDLKEGLCQIVVPNDYRQQVLQTAHGEGAGHFGVRKTYDRVLQHFYWPRLKRDVAHFIETCHTCQLAGKPNESIKPAPLYPIPVVGQPFECILIDCVGPLPPSKSGSIYLLTVMCQATRYPAAFPLRSITTKSVVKALAQFISVFGIPKVLQSDRGSNFTSKMFSEILQQLKIKHKLSSSYHPQSQGALERFHLTLKSLLRAYCSELQRDWEDGLPWLMLAAREVIQDSLGFSPNELVFAHEVRGPLTVLKDGLQEAAPPVSLIDYVEGFRRRLFLAWKCAGKNLLKSQGRMKKYFDRRAEVKLFSPGDQVLALLPIPGSPFRAKFSGPYTVIRQVTERDYVVATPNRKKSSQLCHVNLLKPYYVPSSRSGVSKDAVQSAALAVGGMLGTQSQSVAAEAENEVCPNDSVLLPRLRNSEVLKNLDGLLKDLPVQQRGELQSLLLSFPMLFSDVPTCTDLIEHDIQVADDVMPIKQRFYRVPLVKQKVLDAEVQYLLDNGLAKPCYSSWASPCLLVPKPDGTYRFCTDYRKLNAVTKPDSFPLPRIEDCVDSVGAAKFVTKCDLLKGYYQIPLTPRAQEIAAFVTPSGLYSYKVMSFGLRNAPSSFQRLMNRVISGLEGCAVYLDDLVSWGDTWEEHLSRLKALLERLVAAKLTINLAKCEFAQATVVYLGKVVGQGEVRPVRAKVSAIDGFPPPVTKKELMRFLGMVGYYRSFCCNFSSVVSPLTDLLKGKTPFIWTSVCQEAFDRAKLLLSTAPVLAAPRLDRPFKIQVDASQVGAGAVLLQEDDHNVDRPVCYFSRKFNKYQFNYSTIEKEALALIWALQHFDVYVGGGAHPVIVFSDHNPLTFLHSLQNPNQRLMRWALFLQPYDLQIRHIKGVDNVMADALSRALV